MAHLYDRYLAKIIFLDCQRFFLVEYITIDLREVEEYFLLRQRAVGPEELQIEIPLVLFTTSGNEAAFIDILGGETAQFLFFK